MTRAIARVRTITLLVVMSLLVPGLPAAAAPAAGSTFASVWLHTDSSMLSRIGGVEFNPVNLDSSGDTERLTISIPVAYGVNLAHAVGSVIGTASITPRGAAAMSGQLVEMDPAAYAASPGAEACDPGSHAAVWEMDVKPSGGTTLAIPIAVDQLADGYRLTICFDALHARNLEVSAVDFYADGVFTNPASARAYVFDTLVTPFAADGSPSATTAYELRSYETLPRTLTAVAIYDAGTRILTVSGVLKIRGKPKGGARVDIAAGLSSLRLVGFARTGRRGRYTFRRRLSRAPLYAYSFTESHAYAACPGPSPAPAGCVSYSTDGAGSATVPVILIPAKA